MKKSKGAARPIGRIGRNPVIAVRVPPPLHHRITESAKASGRSMSEEMAWLIANGFQWQEAFGDRVQMLKEAKAEVDRMVRGNFEAEMRRRGWVPVHGSPAWLPPEAALQSSFVNPHAAPQGAFVDLAAHDFEPPSKTTTAKLNERKTSRPPQKKKEA